MKKIFQNKKYVAGVIAILVLALVIIIGVAITTKNDSEKTNHPDSNKPSGLTIEESLDEDSDNQTQTEDTLEVPSDWGDDNDSNVSAERGDEPKQEESNQEQSEEQPENSTKQELETDVDTASGYGELF